MKIAIKCARCGTKQDPDKPRPYGSCIVCLKVICPDCCAKAGRHLLPGLCQPCGKKPEAVAAAGIMMIRIDSALDGFNKALRDLSIKLNITPAPVEEKVPEG